ncbi:MAG: hypothetical protein U0232_26290 [Thermomicrobiales bacterium]
MTLTIPAGFGLWTVLPVTVDGSTLTLFMPNQQGVTTPYTFRAATLTDFNRAIAALRQQDEELRSTQATAAAEVRAIQATAAAEARAFQATATTEAKKQAAVRDANATLASAIRLLSDAGDRLKRDTNYDAALKQYAADWALMQTEYTKLQSEAAKRPFDCYQLGTVKYQLGTVQYVHGSIKYDRSSFDYVVKTVSNDISDVQKNMQKVRMPGSCCNGRWRRTRRARPRRSSTKKPSTVRSAWHSNSLTMPRPSPNRRRTKQMWL